MLVCKVHFEKKRKKKSFPLCVVLTDCLDVKSIECVYTFGILAPCE
jgi:hypothetical protein